MVKRPRRDLRAYLSGTATFIEDIDVRDQLCVSFLRSPFAHARIRSIDAGRLVGRRGISGVFTGADIRDGLAPNVWGEFPLAQTEVVYQGQPVVALVGPERTRLEESLNEVGVDYEPLGAVSDPAAAVRGGRRWLSTATSNVVLREVAKRGDLGAALRDSPHRLALRFDLPRISPHPLEGRGVVIERGKAEIVVYSSTQSPDHLRRFLANSTMDSRAVRVIQTAVGGAFGGKIFPYAEDLACYAISAKIRRNLKWVALPEEMLVTMTHRPDQTHEVEVGYDRSGRILAFRDHVVVDAGAYYGGVAGGSMNEPGKEILRRSTAIDQMVLMATGPYDIRNTDVKVTAVATNKVMMGPIRGSGGMVATFILERVLNQIALTVGLDQFEVRRANLPTENSPRNGPHSGRAVPDLRVRELLEAGRRSRMTRSLVRRASRMSDGRLGGMGVSFYLSESAPPSTETVRLALTKSGDLVLYTSVAPTGQGSERVLATIISNQLRPGRSRVEVRFGDTTGQRGIGTQSSRSISYAGSATLLACQLLVGKVRDALECARVGRGKITFAAGHFLVRDSGGRGRELDFVGAAKRLGRGISVDARYESSESTFSSGCHVSVVEIDKSSGSIRVVRHLTFDDFGTVLDRSALTAQIEGAVMQSVGEALREEVVYDRSGSLACSYRIPPVEMAPTFSHILLSLTKSQHPHGARGAGEAGRIGSLPAIVNAVENAVAKVRPGVFLPRTPLTDEMVRGFLSGA